LFQFPLKRLRWLVTGQFNNPQIPSLRRYVYAGRELLIGLTALGIHDYLVSTYYPEFYLTDEFKCYTFLEKVFCICVTGHVFILRYLAIWTVNDGACIVSGISYDKDPETGCVSWGAVRNAHIMKFLKMNKFDQLVRCHNTNTNTWVMNYLYKRLRFTGSIGLAKILSIMFVAVWHGCYEGYFTAFLFQKLVMSTESLYCIILPKIPAIRYMLEDPQLTRLAKVIGFVYVRLFLGYAFMDFSLLRFCVYGPVYDSVYWYGHVFFFVSFLLLRLYADLMKLAVTNEIKFLGKTRRLSTRDSKMSVWHAD